MRRYLKNNYKNKKINIFLVFTSIVGILLVLPSYTYSFPLDLDSYQDQDIGSVIDQLLNRISIEPFNLIVTIIFGLAIIHTFFASTIHQLALRIERKKVREIKTLKKQKKIPKSFPEHSSLGEILLFLGEMEIILALWVGILGIMFIFYKDWHTFLVYLETKVSFTEPLFIVVIMTAASTKPITHSTERFIQYIAIKLKGIFRSESGAFWYVTLTLGPLLGSLITEVAAITICSLLMVSSIFRHSKNELFKYATFAILLVNISIGGALTNYAAPVIFIVAEPWGITTSYMLSNFGIKILLSVFTSATLGYIVLFNNFKKIDAAKKISISKDKSDRLFSMPLWIIITHYIFLVWIVFNAHHPILFIGSYLIILGFSIATRPYQSKIDIRSPLLIGLFVSGLLIHGGLQGWWIAPLIVKFSNEVIFWVVAVLSALNDNASITYISSLTPNISEVTKYTILSGAIATGGLTILANAPNPSGFSILRTYFKKDSINHFWLLLAAIIPTLIAIMFLHYF